MVRGPCGWGPSCESMTVSSRFSAFGAPRYSRLYWLNIDVRLREIFYRQRRRRDDILPGPTDFCVLEGLGEVANALTVTQHGIDFDRFIVDISGEASEEDETGASEVSSRQPSRMIWNKTSDEAPRLDVYIPDNLSRRLVELYVSKRIDRVELSMQMAVVGNARETGEGLPDSFPLLGDEERLLFRRVRCDLLSVYTSIG